MNTSRYEHAVEFCVKIINASQLFVISVAFLTYNITNLNSVSSLLQKHEAFCIAMSLFAIVQGLGFCVLQTHTFCKFFAVTLSLLGWTLVVVYNDDNVFALHTAGVLLYTLAFCVMFLGPPDRGGFLLYVTYIFTIIFGVTYFIFYALKKYDTAYLFEWFSLILFSMTHNFLYLPGGSSCFITDDVVGGCIW